MNTITNTERKTGIITMTGRPPVRIVEDDWPVIATGKLSRGPELGHAEAHVREHADGRRVVYGTWSDIIQGDPDRAAGELVATGGDTVAAIRRVSQQLGCDDDLVQVVVAALPPEDI